jgi:hypothetical protein
MNKQILNFILLLSISLFYSACGNDKPSTSTSVYDTPSTQQLGKTGVLSIDNLTDQIAQNPENPKHFIIMRDMITLLLIWRQL